MLVLFNAGFYKKMSNRTTMLYFFASPASKITSPKSEGYYSPTPKF